MTPHDFIAKWPNGGGERSDAQPFFEDLCRWAWCRLVWDQTPRDTTTLCQRIADAARALVHAIDRYLDTAAFGWDWPFTDDEILRRLFELNQTRSAK
jgi:hypothetical protein